jgi:DNA-directed RNA polymerase beta subunit
MEQVTKLDVYTQSTEYDIDMGMSSYESLLIVANKVNELVTTINSYIDTLNTKEKSDDITNNRKLDSVGNFTGKLNNIGVNDVLYNIDNALSLCKEIIQYANDRIIVTGIYDGGIAGDPTPPEYIIDGGLI